MIKIINNTNIDFRRLLVLYSKELATLKGQDIKMILFGQCSMSVYSNDKCLLTVID